MLRSVNLATLGATIALCAVPLSVAQAAWEPTRPVEIIVPAGPGGGADQMARTMQGIVTKHSLMKQSMVVINKAGGAGGEGFLDVKAAQRQSAQARHHAVEPVHHAARDRHSVQLEGHHAGRDDGARRVHPLGQRRQAATRPPRNTSTPPRRRTAPSRWAAPAPSRKTRSSPSRSRSRPAPSSPTFRTRAAARWRCSSSAITSIRPSTIRSRRWRSGAPASCGRSACSTPRSSTTRRRSPAIWPGTASRPASRPASTSNI